VSQTTLDQARGILPGLALSALVAVAALTAAPVIGRVAPIPAMVLALVIGIALNPLARQPMFLPGIIFCMKVLLRWAVALLGLRIALGEIAALGLATAALVVVSMALTVASGFLFAAFGQRAPRGAGGRGHRGLCASATLRPRSCCRTTRARRRTSPSCGRRQRASTVAMVLYPLLCTSSASTRNSPA
jgi:hypothetical protein